MRRLVIVVVTAVVLAGCSRSDLSAEAWAVSVCSALTPWRSTITELNQRAAVQMGQTNTVEQTRRNLVDLVTNARDATEVARTAVAGAGVPDVAAGEAVARGFERSLARTRDAYAGAAEDLRGLPGNDETAFYDGVVDVMDRLNRRYEQSGADLAQLESPELRSAFERAPECQ